MKGFFFLFLITTITNYTDKSGRVEWTKFESVELSASDSIAIYDETDSENAPKSIACEYFESKQPTRRLQDKILALNIGLEYGYTTDASFEIAKDSLMRFGHLVSICNNQYFQIGMEHSHPYLTPEAAELLEEIDIRFQENLKEKHQKEYAIYITSALRTCESQRKLFLGNKNATRSTTSHLYDTTFDISYIKLFRNNDAKIIRYKNIQDILTKTLQEMRMEKCCLVLKEIKQQCFQLDFHPSCFFRKLC